jgi:hypothetical protein
VVTAKKLETLSVARLGDWHGDMNNIKYPVQAIDAIRDIILNLAWENLNPTGEGPDGLKFMALAGYLNDDSLTTTQDFQELGINPTAWASRYARTQAIAYANDSVVLCQQTLVQCLSIGKGPYDDIVRNANKGIGALDENGVVVPGRHPWSGAVWAFGESGTSALLIRGPVA